MIWGNIKGISHDKGVIYGNDPHDLEAEQNLGDVDIDMFNIYIIW